MNFFYNSPYARREKSSRHDGAVPLMPEKRSSENQGSRETGLDFAMDGDSGPKPQRATAAQMATRRYVTMIFFDRGPCIHPSFSSTLCFLRNSFLPFCPSQSSLGFIFRFLTWVPGSRMSGDDRAPQRLPDLPPLLHRLVVPSTR